MSAWELGLEWQITTNPIQVNSTCLTLLFVVSAVGIPGRLLYGPVAGKFFGPVRTLIPVAFCAAVLSYIWATITFLGGLYVFSVMCRFFSAGIQSLLPAACAGLTSNVKIGVQTNTCFSLIFMACLTGPPLAGLLMQEDHCGVLYAQIFSGSTLWEGSLALVEAKIRRKNLSIS
ncbi:hypothetical protein BCR34DRAFT_497077 [Clohesyomyces aquaticus]|uniref:Major facilitator superfamily domain-containing protein n=1 Tax=Clohesyomyces aquaticus TaxID=1231657 RepID=A0A1Y1YGX8_9PLEO|nr:hypothetical protein BCR34DRAFT_497077 [Clohesyomyces aquaticus]